MPPIVLAVLGAALDLLAAALGWHDLRIITKPLPALILALAAWHAGGRPCRILGLGLIFAAVGDELLLRTGSAFFMAGMAAFALMQISYMLAFLGQGARWNPTSRLRAAAASAYGIAYILLLTRLLPHAAGFGAPLVVYGFLLILMASFAAQLSPAVAIGGLCFVVSDLTLASAKFLPSFPLAPRLTELVVMGTYFAAQILIAWGMTNAAKQDARNDQALVQESAGHL
ncbi:MAG TPA: lysoplasmalogenase [Candidatus Aquilonibacter sp.]|nr:lysoplasmalogenase [Candidatus Aquilonibacter sp.]